MQAVISNTGYIETLLLMKEKYAHISEDGCFFAIVKTEYDEQNNVLHDFLEIIHEAVNIGYEYVTTIVYPTATPQVGTFSDNVKYVVWLAKSRTKMRFEKDAIREKHIWKDVEWGKREKNYNPKGKDPGNVWIPTTDDGHAKITDHILLEDEGVIKRLLSMSVCGDDYEAFSAPTEHHISSHARESAVSSDSVAISEKVFFKSSEEMSEVLPESVKTVITSPPYWNLKDYFKAGQIGQESYDSYLARMQMVWQQCYEKLMPTGSLWVNINIRVQEGNVILIPYDIVQMCKKIGYFYKGIFIWHKSSGIPTGEKNIVDRHEYVLIFSKSENFSIDFSQASEYKDYQNDVINGKAFWNINRKAGSVGKKYIHPAIYPNELVERIIKIASDKGDVILDPFLGSGTSLIAAAKNGRSFVGYEYYEGFKELMEARFSSEIPEICIEFAK